MSWRSGERSPLGRGYTINSSTHQLINSSTPTVLAFGFVSPWLLWGLALGGVPILIQWLHRRNYTQRVWAAMRFLRAVTKAQSRRLRFESLLLLLIRVLILVLAALAVAEPYLNTAGWLAQSESSVHRLIVIDTSLSMQYEADGRAASERAREAARRIVAGARSGDSFQIVTIGRDGRPLVSEPAFDGAQMQAVVDQLKWTEEFGDVPASLEVAKRVLDDRPQRVGVEVAIISDFQRSNWWPEEQSVRTRIQRALADLAAAGEVMMIRVGDDAPRNRDVGEVTVEPVLATIGASVALTAAVRRSGRMRDVDVNVELVQSDRVLQTQRLELRPPETTAAFTTRWHDDGQQELQIRLPEDGLPADDHRWLTVDVRDELRVLLVNGRESAETLGRATDYVALALAPETSSDGSVELRGGTNYRPLVVSEADFSRTELADFDCIFLCDVPFLSEGEEGRLRSFVRSGGGLVIGMGREVQPGAYNQWLGHRDGGLLPVRLTDVVGEEDFSGEPFHFAVPQGGHPIVEPFIGNPQAGLTTANIYRYYQIDLPESDAERPSSVTGVVAPRFAERPAAFGPRVVLEYSNGDAAILEGAYGAGRVVLITTSLDDQWGSWAVWPSFLPMMHRVVDYATQGAANRSLLVGEPIRLEYPSQTIGLAATVQRPDGRRAPARYRVDEAGTLVRFDDTTQSGIYRVLLGPPINTTELIAVNVDVRESDLDLLDESTLQNSLLGGVEAQLLTGWNGIGRESSVERSPSSLSRWLLCMVVMLLLVEQVMAWNSRYGLYALAVSPLLAAGWMMIPALSVVVGAGLVVFVGWRWLAGPTAR